MAESGTNPTESVYLDPKTDLVSVVFPKIIVGSRDNITVSKFFKLNTKVLNNSNHRITKIILECAPKFPFSYFPYLTSICLTRVRGDMSDTFTSKVPFVCNGNNYEKLTICNKTWIVFHKFIESNTYREKYMENFEFDIGMPAKRFKERYSDYPIVKDANIACFSLSNNARLNLNDLYDLNPAVVSTRVFSLTNPQDLWGVKYTRVQVNTDTVRHFYPMLWEKHCYSIFRKLDAKPSISTELRLKPKEFLYKYRDVFQDEDNRTALEKFYRNCPHTLVPHIPILLKITLENENMNFRYKTKSETILFGFTLPKGTSVDLETLKIFWHYFEEVINHHSDCYDLSNLITDIGLTTIEMFYSLYDKLSKNTWERKYFESNLDSSTIDRFMEHLPINFLGFLKINTGKDERIVSCIPKKTDDNTFCVTMLPINPRTVSAFMNIFSSTAYQNHPKSSLGDYAISTTDLYKKYFIQFMAESDFHGNISYDFLSANDPEDAALMPISKLLFEYQSGRFVPGSDYPTILSVIPQVINETTISYLEINIWALFKNEKEIFSASGDDAETKIRFLAKNLDPVD